ncbi:MAG: hypothetical protein GW893_00520 [Armatimonadetes bacterium]|nr:hypothetical protein [Armatimonadota bacterium]PIU66642.1 MAG: hypothetical protein COS85_04130 [Armatimonadetes bacterium CG07_land_8_20_14_0_80_59_28]
MTISRYTPSSSHCSRFALLLLLMCSPAHLLPRAHASVSPADLEALKQLFQKDPATTFAKSWKMFQEPMRGVEDCGVTSQSSRDRFILVQTLGRG